LIAKIEGSEVYVSDYSMIKCGAKNKNTGSVVLYVRDDIKYEIILARKLQSNCWCVTIKKKLYKNMIAIIYHLPSALHGELVRFLKDIVEELVIKGEYIIIGDFNINFMIHFVQKNCKRQY